MLLTATRNIIVTRIPMIHPAPQFIVPPLIVLWDSFGQAPKWDDANEGHELYNIETNPFPLEVLRVFVSFAFCLYEDNRNGRVLSSCFCCFLNFLANLRDFLVPTRPGSPIVSCPSARVAGG